MDQNAYFKYFQKNTKTMNCLFNHIWKYPKEGLKYVQLGNKLLRKIVIYLDASFATSKNGTSEFGYLIFMADKRNKAKLIDYASNK